MRAYVATTGILFALLVVAHIARMVTESAAFATNPAYLAITTASALLCVWAVVVYRGSKR